MEEKRKKPIDHTGNESHRRKKKKKRDHSRKYFWIIQIAILAALIGIVVMFARSSYGSGILNLRAEAKKLVADSTIEDFQGQRMSTIYDSDGNIIAVLKNEKNIQYLSSEEIPQTVKDAFVSIEDKRFYKHGGVDLIATLRASVKLINRNAITQGASTITQQLSRNIFLTHQVSWQRKVEEMFISWEIEKIYSKDQILEFYINNIFYANNCYGIEAASQKYFGRTISECSLSETAFLCAIPNSPTHYDPLKNKDNTLLRRDAILEAMYDNDKITEEEYKEALLETIEVESHSTGYESSWATPYAIHCVVEELMAADGFEFQYDFAQVTEKEDYEEAYNEAYEACRESLYTGGYRIYTSIDTARQKALQEAIDTQLADYNTKNTNGTYALQSAATCIDNETGRVVAIVGGRSQEDDISYDYNRAYLSFRQPGSSIKPLVVYTPALEHGYTADSTVNDVKVADGPENSGGYLGKITLRTAVEKSKNTVAWQIFNELTPEVGLSYLLKMKYTEIMPQDYTGSAALGGLTNGASSLEMASGYATLANEGRYRTPTCIVRVEDSYGETVLEPEQTETEVYESAAAHEMTNILEGVLTRGTASGKGLTDMPSAGKTGTTNENKDGWFAGYSAYYTTTIWVGYDTPRWLEGLTGSAFPAEIWHNYMEEIHAGLERKELND